MTLRGFVRHVAVIGLYFLIGLLITWPALTTATTHFIGSRSGDSAEVARHMWWFTQALRTGQDFFYQSTLGYPEGFSSAVFLSVPLYVLPMGVFAFVLPLALAFNLQVWLALALNGWAMWWLARSRLGADSMIPALLAGLIFMAYPAMQGHIADGHSGLIVMWPLPLYLWALFRLVERDRPRWFEWLLAVVLFMLVPMGHILQSIYALAPVTGLFFLARLWQRDWRGAGRVVVVTLVGGVLYALYLLPVVLEVLSETAYSGTDGTVRFSLDALAIVTPSFFNPFYDAVLSYPRRVLGTNLTEGAAYIGLGAGLLAMIGFIGRRRARWWLLLALVAWVLALGPLLKVFDQPLQIDAGDGFISYLTLPWALLQELPGMSIARTPGRFAFVLALTVAMLAAYGAAVLRARLGKNQRVAFAIFGIWAAFILFDYQLYWPMPTSPATVPQAVADLRQREDVRAVFNVPYEHLLAAKDALLLQTAHEQPLIAGQVSRSTPVNPARLMLLQATLDPALLTAAGADVIIFHHARAREIGSYDVLSQRLNAQLGQPTYRDDRIALYDVPAPESDPAFVALSADGAYQELNEAYRLSVYAPEPGWLLEASDVSAQARQVVVALDGVPVHRRVVDGWTNGQFAAYLPEPGYYTFTIALDPPCPQRIDPVLQCLGLQVGVPNQQFIPQAPPPPIVYAGLMLDAYQVAAEASWLAIRLSWQFDDPLVGDVVRFVQVLDENGVPVAQDDTPLGPFVAGARWSEQIDLPIDELRPGAYEVRAGWYRFNADGSISNFSVSSEVPGAAIGAPVIGRFSLP